MKAAFDSSSRRWVDPADHFVDLSIKPSGRHRFYYHYNKPASQRAGRRLWSVHFLGKCSIVRYLTCAAMAESHERSTQPVCVMRGWAKRVDVFYSAARKGLVAEIA